MLWRTVLAYFLPAHHPGLRRIHTGPGEELLPKMDEWGQRVDRDDWNSVWDAYRADRIRAENRARVRPFMGTYIRRWAGLALFLWLIGRTLAAAGLAVVAWVFLTGAVAALVMTVMLLLLLDEMRR